MSSNSSFFQKRVFITGINGFIGSRLASVLSDEGAEIHGLVSPSSRAENLKDGGVSFMLYRGDIRKREEIIKIVRQAKPDIVYHFASYGNHPQHYNDKPEIQMQKMLEVNTMGTAHLLEALAELDFECLVHTGSAFAEYGPDAKPMHENKRLNPVTYYGASKASATLLCGAFAQSNNQRKVITLRPLYVYGPGEWAFRFIPTVISKCSKGEKLKLTSRDEKKCFVYIEDVLEAYRLAYLRSYESPLVVNVGSAHENTLGDVIDIVEKVFGKTLTVEEGAYKELQWPSPSWATNVDLAKQTLAWESKTDLTSGILKTIQWMQRAKTIKA